MSGSSYNPIKKTFSIKEDAFKNFVKLTEKYMCLRVIFIDVEGWGL